MKDSIAPMRIMATPIPTVTPIAKSEPEIIDVIAKGNIINIPNRRTIIPNRIRLVAVIPPFKSLPIETNNLKPSLVLR